MDYDQLEKAARKLCEFQGVDPDDVYSGPGASLNELPNWMRFTNELNYLNQQMQAIEFAKNENVESI